MLTDIQKELPYYKDLLKGKIIYCPCDTTVSNFWKYLVSVQSDWGIKSVTVTHPSTDIVTISVDNKIIRQKLSTPGTFQSYMCTLILERSDIVITNPPFSLFRSFVEWLGDKQFLILGNQNAVTQDNIFNLFKENKLWYGVTIHSGDREFVVPDDYEVRTDNYRIEDGKKILKVNGVRWFTNLDHGHKPTLELTKTFSEAEYPQYDNYPAREVSKRADIPVDYFAELGVPITFLDKYNERQFKIIGNSKQLAQPVRIEGKIKNPHRFVLNGKILYDRIVIKQK